MGSEQLLSSKKNGLKIIRGIPTVSVFRLREALINLVGQIR